MVVIVVDCDDFVGICVGCGVVDVGVGCVEGNLVGDWNWCVWWYG